MGISVLPMPFMIDGGTYFEDITLTQEAFYEKLKGNADISTSQPSPESVMELWDRLLKENDQVVHIPMSSGLSSSCGTSMMLAEEEPYAGRVFVVDNQRISVTQYQSVKDALLLIKRGADGAQVKERLQETKFDSVIFITVDTLKYLKKGGRVTPAAAALGTLLKIKPVLIILGEKLDAFAKARTTASGRQIMINAAKNDVTKRFGRPLENCGIWVDIAHTDNEKAARDFQKELLEIFPGTKSHIDPLSLSVACHIGPGSLAVALTVRNDLEA